MRVYIDMETKSPPSRTIEKPSQILCQTAQSVDLQGTVQRVTRHAAVVEFSNPQLVLRVSEALDPCRLFLHEHPVYSGRAVITSLQTSLRF